jgi:hypothetical protein
MATRTAGDTPSARRSTISEAVNWTPGEFWANAMMTDSSTLPRVSIMTSVTNFAEGFAVWPATSVVWKERANKARRKKALINTL